ncbi:MAG: CBS domain-containing protein [Actinomycetota bacterium]
MRVERRGYENQSTRCGQKVETISPSASIQDLVNFLNTHHVGALVVSSDGRTIEGIVSERDVVRAMPGKLDQLIGMHVRDLMTVGSCDMHSRCHSRGFDEHHDRAKNRHIPVVDESGSAISIVSIGDVVKAHISELDTGATSASRLR